MIIISYSTAICIISCLYCDYSTGEETEIYTNTYEYIQYTKVKCDDRPVGLINSPLEDLKWDNTDAEMLNEVWSNTLRAIYECVSLHVLLGVVAELNTAETKNTGRLDKVAYYALFLRPFQ